MAELRHDNSHLLVAKLNPPSSFCIENGRFGQKKDVKLWNVLVKYSLLIAESKLSQLAQHISHAIMVYYGIVMYFLFRIIK